MARTVDALTGREELGPASEGAGADPVAGSSSATGGPRVVRRGPLERIGRWSARHAVLVVVAWLAAAVPLLVLAPSLNRVGVQDEAGFLPASAPSAEAQQVVNRLFPQVPGVDSVVVVLSRPRPFTLVDLAFIGRLDQFLRSGSMARQVGSVESPVTAPVLDRVLVSPGRRTALVIAAVRPTPFTPKADAVVSRLQVFLDHAAPPGLRHDVTGDVGLGADWLAALVSSFDRAALVAGILVVLVMVAVYRSLLALVVPLATVGVAVAASVGTVGLLAAHGLAVSSLAGTFMVVIVFGAGTDYCLFLVARQRSELTAGAAPGDAAGRALATAGRVVVTSGTIVVLSFGAMVTARFGMYRTMGPALAVAVAVTVAAACTFTPALMALLGRRLVSARTQRRSERRSPTWTRLGGLVERRPALLAAVGIIGLLAVGAGTLGLHQSFDFVDELPPGAGGRQGYDTIARAFGPGALAPLEVVVTSPRSMTGPAGGRALAVLTDTLARQPGVVDVRSAADPLGTGPVTAASGSGGVGQASATALQPGRAALLADDDRAALVEITLATDPFDGRAQDQVATVRADAQRILAANGTPATVLVAGPTAQFTDIAHVAQGDLWRIIGAVLVVLAVVLAVVLDSLVAPLVLAASLVLSFGAALGVTTLIFEGLLGQPSLSFWVAPFLFVILVALGADYTVLVVTAIRAHVDRGVPTGVAAAEGLTETAPVVSAAGLVLAGTFLALVVTPMPTLKEVGVAVGLGVLADTFVVRPLVVPAVVALLGRATWWRPRRGDGRATAARAWRSPEDVGGG